MSSSVNEPDRAVTGSIDGDRPVEDLEVDAIVDDPDDEANQRLERSSLLYEFKPAWLEHPGEGVKVAILDTGIDLGHPAFEVRREHGNLVHAARVLKDRVEVAIAGGERVGDAVLVQDLNGHGTHCAGIVAARPLGPDPAGSKRLVAHRPRRAGKLAASARQLSEDARRSRAAPDRAAGTAGGLEATTGWRGLMWVPTDQPEQVRDFGELGVRFSGVAPLAELMIYKVTEGASDVVRLDDLALAINTAVDDGADIVSISIGGQETTDQLYAAVHRALGLRRMIIVSAGNRGRLRDVNIGYPGRYGGVITVAAHDGFGQPSAFTSAGGEVDMSGPGEAVWSTWAEGSYASRSGTSMAAPWVAGISALILGKHRRFGRRGLANDTPLRNNEELRRHLLLMAAHRGHFDPNSGYGPLWPGDYFARMSVELEQGDR